MRLKPVFLTLIVTIFVSCNFAYSQTELPPSLSVSDVKQIRELIVEKNYWQAQAAEEKRQKLEWQKSSGNWERLYNSEKHRADVIQQKRIDELQAANGELGKANVVFRMQSDDDKRQLSENAFTIRKLKSERKWVFATGFGLGAAAGGFGGYQVGRRFSF